MKNILLFGAGKSATSLIAYLGKCSDENDWKFVVCDSDLDLVKSKIIGFKNAVAKSINVTEEVNRHELIEQADIVISMLPAALHFLVAKDCVLFSKNLLTASYIDDSIQSLEKEIVEKNLLFIGEMGLDPGIDHMSAMKMIHKIKKEGGKILSFKSHCGGLVAPESDDNPWHYKITWNPANVVSAGSSGASFLKNNEVVQIPYKEIFAHEENVVDIPDLGPLAFYANRDSLNYIDTYDMKGIQTFIRTTLRYPAFNKGWDILVNAGFTSKDDFEFVKDCKTFNEWFQLKMNQWGGFSKTNRESEFMEQVDFLGMRNDELIPAGMKNSAGILQYLLENSLIMKPDDKDMIVMLHELDYEIGGMKKNLIGSLIVKGKDQLHTAMAQTVGLPLGIAAKLILQNQIHLTGLHIPVVEEIYNPVLKELAQNGIQFSEFEKDIS
ncbi:MAG: saccharopine dehydrogenase C-terminal domain-containing protein [Ginsengibacter sp.]